MNQEILISNLSATTEVRVNLGLSFNGEVVHKESLVKNVLDSLVHEINTKGIVPDEDEAVTVKVTGTLESLSSIVKNSLFAMVDLFLDDVKGEQVDGQEDNIAEFIIDCHNLHQGEPVYELIKEKFIEEFQNDNVYVQLEKYKVLTLIEISVEKLIRNAGVPALILTAVDEAYKYNDESILADKISSIVNRWNGKCSQTHDEYLGEITMLVFEKDYDVRQQANHKSDYEKLSEIWKVVTYGSYSSKELIKQTQIIINM